ncbi:hypothetical protein B0A52_03061 [Exophiala mesophila]|uniref:Uncharacterized protein n=1 Tax=Exophiala mesophila TaxID=212818 RepID=A0A438NCB7_EXOME|nr:hypothetical protein B0A52_03061 [Exophiala mesophila]
MSTSHELCDESPNNIHVFPNVCDKCKESNNYVIAEYIAKVPGAKFDLVRAWKEQSRRRKSESSSVATNANSSTSSIQSDNSALAGGNGSTSASESSSSSSASIKTSSVGASDLTEVKVRLCQLKGRVEQLLAKLPAQKMSMEKEVVGSNDNKD